MSTSITHVYSKDKHVGMVALQASTVPDHVKETPWLLLHDTGRIDRFATQREAKDEARKSYPACRFSKT